MYMNNDHCISPDTVIFILLFNKHNQLKIIQYKKTKVSLCFNNYNIVTLDACSPLSP